MLSYTGKCISQFHAVILLLSSPGLLSSPQVVPAVPGWCVTEKAAAPSSATTASRLGIPTRRVTRLASRGRSPSAPTVTIHPATHKSRDQVSVWKTCSMSPHWSSLVKSSQLIIHVWMALTSLVLFWENLLLQFTFTDWLQCVYRTVKSPLLPFADIFASLQTFLLH